MYIYIYIKNLLLQIIFNFSFHAYTPYILCTPWHDILSLQDFLLSQEMNARSLSNMAWGHAKLQQNQALGGGRGRCGCQWLPFNGDLMGFHGGLIVFQWWFNGDLMVI